jgi:isochorismate synthase
VTSEVAAAASGATTSGVAASQLDTPLEAEIRAVLAPLVDRALVRGVATLVSATIPIPRPDPLALFSSARALGHEPSLWLQPAAAFALLGVGSAWTIEAEGAQRFDAVSRAWQGLIDAGLMDVPAGVDGVGPMLLGGFGFDSEPATSAVWRGFEGARLVLPKLLLTLTATSAWLTSNIVVEQDDQRADADAVVAAAGRLWADLRGVPSDGTSDASAAASSEDGRARPLEIAAHRPGASDWRATAARFAGAVGRGRLDKVVLTRSIDLIAESPIDVPGVLGRLAEAAPESTVFALSRGQRTFLGASPERLIALDGREFRTVAMAGSIRRGVDAAEDERLAAALLESDKEREEHDVVVQMLGQTLAPLADRLTIADGPSVVRLTHVQHLVTEVSGRLSEPRGILALVETLHPTPAVGGAPRELALQLIAEEERHERGWYAGPIGWIDRHGDGEFAVALRCGVVDGREATLFAGCGIVADSDPQKEWDESLVKLRALGSALGQVEP